MEVMIFLIPLALCLAGMFLIAFLWAVSAGQYDDVETPKHRILIDDPKIHQDQKRILK